MSLRLSDKGHRAAAMYAKGERMVDICHALKCSDKLVYRSIGIAGVPVRSKVDTAARRAEIVRMYGEGMTVAAIARQLGIHYSTASEAIANVRVKPISLRSWRDKMGLRLGVLDEVTPDALAVIAKKIKRGETILACMARLIVQDGCRDKKE